MGTKLKVRRIGNSLGVILPKEEFERLGVKEGDALYVVEAPGVGISLTPYDPDFEAAMEAYEQTRRRYRNALRELAK
jgi:putative addiction module antidote